MGNCLDCLRNSSRYSPNGSKSLEEGRSLMGKDSGKELASVLLKDENSRVLDDCPSDSGGNNKQPSNDGAAQIEEDNRCPRPAFLKGLDGEADSYSPTKSTVVRRLFNSPKKPHSDRLPSSPNTLNMPLEYSEDECRSGKKGRATVDVNTANNHQLCVVGFTKAQSHDIINYRILHGRFHCVTDVKAVPGISEETWLNVQSRITLVPSSALIHIRSPQDSFSSSTERVSKPYNGKIQSRSEDVIVLDSDDDDDDVQIIEKDEKRATVDLNHANIHQLCCVGFNKSQSQDVIKYRINAHGFDSIDEIKCVPSISEPTFTEVSKRLTLTPVKSRRSTPKETPRRRVRSHSMIPSPVQKPCYSPGKDMFLVFGADDSNQPNGSLTLHDQLNSHAKSHINASFPNGVSSRSPVTPRGTIGSPKSPGSSAGRGTKSIRVATWNLQCFSTKKVDNPGVLEVVCTTIIRHGFDVVAIQEIGSRGEPLQKVCNELNEPTLPALKSLGSSKRKWKCFVSPEYTGRMFEGVEYNGFLWNGQLGLCLNRGYLIHDFKDFFVRKPFVGEFMINGWRFDLLSLHLRAEGWGRKHTEELHNEVSHLPLLVTSMEAVEADIILLGDFNIEPSATCFDAFRSYGYVNVFNSDEPTNISAANPEGSKCYDNIWISEDLKKRRCKGTIRNVVRRNLQHHMISDSKSPGKPGTVSDHCPVWAEFSV